MGPLNKDRLLAFNQVAICKNFHRAADKLCISQSALSQRILKLEMEIETTLLVRGTKEVSLTPAGQILLKYVQNIIKMEEDVLERISGRKEQDKHGTIRVAAYSSILRSAVIPSLEPIIAQSPDLQIEFFCREIRELPAMLRSGETDFILLDYLSDAPNFARQKVGSEAIVHIQPKNRTGVNLPFLDHDEKDMTTYHFFQQQGHRNVCLHRCFYDNIYGIIDGVCLGLGQAIVSRHLIYNQSELEIVSHPVDVANPIAVYYLEGQYLTRLQQKALKSMVDRIHLYL